MSTFYSDRSGHSVELRKGGYGTVKDPVLGEQSVVIKPLVVRFMPLDVPLPVYGLPAKDGLARGVLYPLKAAQDIRRRSTELGPAVDNLPATNEELAKWLVEKLRKHSGNGAQYMEVPDADEVLDGEAMDTVVAQSPAPQMGVGQTPLGVIVKQGEGRSFCKACQRSMKNSGINGHSRSTKHLAAIREYNQRLLEASGVS